MMTRVLFIFALFVNVASSWLSDRVIREKFFPLAAAAYSDEPEACINKFFRNASIVDKQKQLCGDGYVEPENCFGYLGIDHQDRAIFFSFRGTRGLLQLAYEARRTVFKDRIQMQSGGTVSEYFYSVYRSILDSGILNKFIALRKDYPDYEVWVAGHSLGGAMASIAATELAHFTDISSDKLKLITFGQPRTGDQDYADAHDRLLKYTYRVTHGRDIVAHVPPHNFEGYIHHRNEIWYNNNMTAGQEYVVCEEQEDYKCSNKNYWNYSILAHLYYFNVFISDYGISGCEAPLE